MSTGERPGWGARIGAMLFSGLFMLAFGGGGLLFGVLPLLDTARQAWIVRGWQPVSARVIEARLDTRRGSKGGATYAVVARYAYRFDGRDFEASRVGLDTWSVADNIGDWQARWHHRLADAQARGQPVAAWVDPRRPERAVLERRVRWGLLALRLPFALLFTAVGVGAAVVFVRTLRGRPTPLRPRVASTSARAAAARRQARAGGPAEGVIAARPAGQPLPPLPAGVRGDLLGPGRRLRFVRRWPRVLGLLLAAPVLLWLLVGTRDAGAGLASLVGSALWASAWLALALQLASLRWAWRIEGGVLWLEQGSWLRSRALPLTRADLGALSQRLVYTSRTGNGPTIEHRRLVAHPPGALKRDLTPALAGVDAVQAVAWHLQQALQLDGRGPER